MRLDSRPPSKVCRGAAERCVALVSLVAAVLLGFAACNANKGDPQLSPKAEGAPVTVAAVMQKTVPVELRAIGNVEAYSQVSVKSQVEGQLERAHFREGQEVNKGDLLFNIDPRTFQAAVKQAEANLARDAAQAQHARVEAERYRKLVEDGIVSKEQYDQFRTSAEALEAAVRADRAAEENARVLLGYCTILSPINGRTGRLMVYQGNVVKANDATLVVINQVTPVYVNFAVPEKNLSEVKRRMAAGPLRVKATIPNEESRPLEGALSFVDNAVDSATGTIRLKATFTNGERRLWPGQFVNVVMVLTSLPNAVVVPSQAVQTGQQGQYAFVVKPDLTVDLRSVVTGETIGGETVIQRGLQPGEEVVTDGQLLLLPGAKVEVKKGSVK